MSLGGPIGRLPVPVSPVPGPLALGGVGLVGGSFFLTVGGVTSTRRDRTRVASGVLRA